MPSARRHRTRAARLAALRIVEPGLLLDFAACLEQLDLAPRLELDRALHEAERIEVLDLAAGAELFLARFFYRNVRVAAERALLHVPVADADPHDEPIDR